MSDEDLLEMHPEFASWNRPLEIGNDPDRLAARWKGVSQIVTNADRGDVEALIQLVFKTRKAPSTTHLQNFRAAFKEADTTFEMQGNDRELQVLAGACLAVIMDEGDVLGAAAALAISTTGLGGARRADVPMNLVDLAEDAISSCAEENRKRPKLAKYQSAESPRLNFERSIAKVQELGSFDGVEQALSLAAESTQNALKVLAQQQSNAILLMENFLQIQDEELQMLWWLIGERSWDYDCLFNAVPVDAQPLVFAKELADNTRLLPGPASIKALLSRAGLKERKKIAIPVAINGVNEEWLKSEQPEVEFSPVSTPIHFAIKRRLETGAGDAWVAGWAAATEIDATYSLSTLSLSIFFYREQLLLQSM